ncbi:MAG TPA: hypothetical protein VIA18_28855 [Polyangia bacterium]|jgi:hypothetical protein|nr:hypothetical protein [Polyangia bacterium]
MSAPSDYPPLITARSPSYERARRELAHPSPVGDSGVVAILSKLYEAEENARAACTAAAQVVDTPALAKQFEEAANVHAERRDALGALVVARGGLPPKAEQVRQLLDHGEDTVRQWVIDDKAHNVDEAVSQQLVAMRRELEALYAEAIGDPDLGDAQRDALRALAPS